MSPDKSHEPRIDRLIERIVAGASATALEAELVGLDPNDAGVRGRTPLMVAASLGRLEAMQVLIRHGATIQTTGIEALTALHEASANGETEVARYLLSLGAEIDATTTEGTTPLMCAAAWGHLEVAKLDRKSVV